MCLPDPPSTPEQSGKKKKRPIHVSDDEGDNDNTTDDVHYIVLVRECNILATQCTIVGWLFNDRISCQQRAVVSHSSGHGTIDRTSLRPLGNPVGYKSLSAISGGLALLTISHACKRLV